MDDSFYVKKCLTLIEEKLQWEDKSLWATANFKKLSSLILASSGILISTNTLRRLFGKIKTNKEYSSPQIETKNALAQFLKYNDWESFKENNKINRSDEYNAESNILKVDQNRNWAHRYWWKIALSILTLFLSYLFFLYQTKYSSGSTIALEGKFTFTGSFLNGSVPHNAVFTYEISGLRSESAYVDYGNGIEVLTKSKGTLRRDYNEPNLYHVRLVVNGKEIYSLPVVVKSNGWHPSISFGETSYFAVDSSFLKASKGRLHFRPEDSNLYVLGKAQGYWVNYRNIKDYDVDGDNFTLVTKLKNNKHDGGLICYDAICEVKGTKQNITAFLIEKGCKMWIKMQIGEKVLSGQKDNLKSFEQDLSEYRVLKMEVRDKNVNYFIDDKLIYANSYKSSAGIIKGLIFTFRGNGSVDFVNLYNGSGELVYKEDFD